MNGILLVDKPSSLTSHDVVARLRRSLKTKEVGHCGTLDPLATGLLVAVIGEGTKLSPYFLEQNKIYEVEILMGKTTDTLDRTGQVLSESQDYPSSETIHHVIQQLTGDFEWAVPMYSAVKVNGQKLYELARAGETIETPVKKMSFKNVKSQILSENRVKVSFEVSKGSFVRTWVERFGQLIGCGATVGELRRLQSGAFKIEQSLTLDQIEAMSRVEQSEIQTYLLSPSQCLSFKTLKLNSENERKIRNGLISHELKALLLTLVTDEVSFFVQLKSISTGKLVAVIEFVPFQGFKLGRVLNY